LIISTILSTVSLPGIVRNNAYGSFPASIVQTPDQPSLFNLAGEEITGLEVGQQGVIKISLHNSSPTPVSFVVLVEVRDGSGITEFLAWQSAKLEVNDDYTIGISWSPKDMCGYYEGCESREIRSFVLSSLADPQVLSPVYAKSGITVIGSVPKTPQIEHQYSLSANGRIYNLGYSFSGDGRLVNVDVDAHSRTILLSLVTQNDGIFTIMIPKGLFDSILIGTTQQSVGLYTLVDGVETPFEQIIDFDRPSVTYVITIEEEAEEIELGGKVGFESQFLGYFGRQLVSLDMSAVERNETEAMEQLAKIDDAFKSCELRLIEISYGLGSMKVAVRGLDWEEQCVLAIVYEIEMGEEKLECSVPRQTMSHWSSWRNSTLPQINEIIDYCEPADSGIS
jgi:hypothetical protein